MKVLAYVLRLVNWLITLLTCVFAFLWFVDLVNLETLGGFAVQVNLTPSSRPILAILVVLVVGLNLAYFIGSLFTRQYATHLKLNADKGDFSIALSAIENSLRRSVKKLPEVHDVHIRIYKSKKALAKPMRIHTSLSVWEGTRVKELTEKIQEVIRLRFNEIVEVAEEPVFEIAITNMVERDARRTESRKKDSGNDPRMFYGPEYPISKD